MRPWRQALSWVIVRQCANFDLVLANVCTSKQFLWSVEPSQRSLSVAGKPSNPTVQSQTQPPRASNPSQGFGGALWQRYYQVSPRCGSALTPQLTDKLRDLDCRYQESINELSQASSSLTPADLTKLHKEIGRLEPVVSKWQNFQSLTSEVEEVRTLLNDDDSEVRLEAERELVHLREQLTGLEQDLILSLLPRDKDDDRSVLLEIRPGPGGEEAALFAADLFKMYSLFSAVRGWKFEVLQEGSTLVALVEGDSVFQQLKYENGVHRVQRVPVTETKGRIHTSTASVVVMPQPDEVSVDIQEKDLKIETMRASGAGGQHVNTTDSAVRITHLPTGLSVHNMGERSQHKNKAQALKILTARLYDMERQKAQERERLERKSAIGTGDRSERIRTYNFPENRIVDHRVGVTVNGISEMLMGQKMDSFIEALEMKEKYAKMASMEVT